MQQRKIVNELNNIHQHRQFMAFKSCEVIILNRQRPTVFNFINTNAIEQKRNVELNYKNAFELK